MYPHFNDHHARQLFYIKDHLLGEEIKPKVGAYHINPSQAAQ
jgi:hypothetical protein